ncbi:GrpE [Fragilaria crotonensis]|nr:GrpE [Fragilaria crotonensis]
MMIPSTTTTKLVILSTVMLLAISSSSITSVSAFTIAKSSHHSSRQVLVPTNHFKTAPPLGMLFGSKKSKGFAKDVQNGDTAPADDDGDDETAVDVDDIVQEADDAADDVEENQPSEEDQLMTSLKEAIHNAESELKAKKATLSRIEEDVEKYTKVGYARRVAQMEDMRRIRLSMQSSNKDASKAAIIQNFLPVMDELRHIQDDIGDVEFGKKYSGLYGTMSSAFKEMGVEEYGVAVGEPVNPQKVATIEEEYSADIPKGRIIRPVSMGMELAGNVLRLAQAVVSLGPVVENETVEEAPAVEEEETADE